MMLWLNIPDESLSQQEKLNRTFSSESCSKALLLLPQVIPLFFTFEKDSNAVNDRIFSFTVFAHEFALDKIELDVFIDSFFQFAMANTAYQQGNECFMHCICPLY